MSIPAESLPPRPGRRRADVPTETFRSPKEPAEAPEALTPVEDAPTVVEATPVDPAAKPGLRARRRARREERLGRTSAVRLTRVSPWRATTVGLVYSIILAFVVEGLIYFLHRAFEAAGVFDKMVSAVAPTGSDAAAKLESWLTLEKFLTVGGVFAASLIVIVPMTIFLTAVVYNLTARLMGGVRLTFMGDRQRG